MARALCQASMRQQAAAALLMAWACTSHGEELIMHGTTYPPACAERQWPGTHEDLLHVAGSQAPQDLALLVRADVCGSGPRAERMIRRHAPQRVLHSTTGTGEDSHRRLVGRSVLVPRAGAVCAVSVLNEHPDGSVSFFVNEACAHNTSLRFTGGSWWIVHIGDGCD